MLLSYGMAQAGWAGTVPGAGGCAHRPGAPDGRPPIPAGSHQPAVAASRGVPARNARSTAARTRGTRPTSPASPAACSAAAPAWSRPAENWATVTGCRGRWMFRCRPRSGSLRFRGPAGRAPGPTGGGEAAHPAGFVQMPGEGTAGNPRRGHLHHHPGPDPPALADHGAGDIDAGGAQVLAEQAGRDPASEFLRPPAGVLVRVGVEGLQFAAVVPAVGLGVRPQAQLGDLDRAAGRPLVDGGTTGRTGVRFRACTRQTASRVPGSGMAFEADVLHLVGGQWQGLAAVIAEAPQVAVRILYAGRSCGAPVMSRVGEPWMMSAPAAATVRYRSSG